MVLCVQFSISFVYVYQNAINVHSIQWLDKVFVSVYVITGTGGCLLRRLYHGICCKLDSVQKILELGIILSTWVYPMGRGWWFLLVEPRSREGETSRAHVILVHVHNNYTDHPPPPEYAPKLDCSTPLSSSRRVPRQILKVFKSS